ncbi:MAG: hypothetical protein HZA54_14455 [Planctomycetes bacterium]|nr:hypothetical protein [Planctomycetota bacterium]
MKKKVLMGVGGVLALAIAALAYPHIRYAGHKCPLPWVGYTEGLAQAKSAGKPILLKIGATY